MKKKILIPVITAAIMGFAAIGASARNLDMYVNNHHVVRDIQTVGRFDMLPVLDIAGELGFNCSFDGTTIKLYNDSRSYKFTMGKAAAYDQNGKWYGLDVVPQTINGSVRIPYKFFCDAMGLSYTWDDVTSTIFLGSDRTYNWLINTKEYKQANPKYMADLYSSYLLSNSSLLYSSKNQPGGLYFTPNEMWYYIADVNYDDILDLIVSAESYYSNGIMIYTYDGSYVKKVFDEGFPYSSGVTRLTLAKYNGKFGIFTHRQNSTDIFSFSYIYNDWTMGTDMIGHHYENEWNINGENIGEKNWRSRFNAIEPVSFYDIWKLQSMG